MRVRIQLACVASLALPLLPGCGGGGDATAPLPVQPPAAPATFAIGGSVSGLVGSAVLQINGGETLEVTTNGAFAFPSRIERGARYSVTVLRQPPGPDCAITGGTGNAAADVAMSVVCTVDPETRFVVLQAFDVYSRRSTGLYALSNKQTDRPLIPIVSGEVQVLSLLADHALDAEGVVTGARPGAIVYRTVGAAGGDHLWSVDLSGDSSLVPRQVGSLTLAVGPGPTVSASRPLLCLRHNVLRDLRDAFSAFHVLGLSTDPVWGCSGDGQSAPDLAGVVVLTADPAGTAPRAVPSLELDQLTLEPVYRSDGRLAGLYRHTLATADVDFVRDETFSNAVVVLRDVSGLIPFSVGDQLRPLWTDRTGRQTRSVLDVSGTDWSIYRADGSGSVVRLTATTTFFNRGPQRVGDEIYVYVQDPDPSQARYHLVRVPTESPGGARTVLSATARADCEVLDIAAVLADRLLLRKSCESEAPASPFTELVTIPRDGSDAPRPWAVYRGRGVNRLIVADDQVLVETASADPPPPGTARYNIEVRALSGALVQPEISGALPLEIERASGSVILRRDLLPVGDPNVGGSLSALTFTPGAAPVLAPLRTADGQNAELPRNAVYPVIVPIGRNGFYGQYGLPYPLPQSGFSIDATRGLVTQRSLPDTSLELVRFDPFFSYIPPGR